VPKPSAFEVKVAIEKLKNRYISPGTDQFLEELIQAECREVCSEIHKLVSSLWNKEELHEQWKDQSFYSFIRKVMKQTVVIIEAYHCYQLHTNSYPAFICQVFCDTAFLPCISLKYHKN
jgi:hypothetical protein